MDGLKPIPTKLADPTDLVRIQQCVMFCILRIRSVGSEHFVATGFNPLKGCIL